MSIKWDINAFGRICNVLIPEDEPITETIKIPSAIDGIPVLSLGKSLFAGNLFLKTVIIPSSVNKIGFAAFKGCKNLRTVIFEEGSNLEVISNLAFNFCDIMDFPFKSLKKLQIIGEKAFSNIFSLGVVDLSDSNVEELSKDCFANSGVTDIYFPKNLNVFEVYCLGNTKLKKFDFSNINRSTLVKDCAFKNNRFLEEIIFPDKLMELETESFAGCKSLKEITIPPHVNLGLFCFSGCSLETVVLEKGVPDIKLIPRGAFYQCDMLKSVQINADVNTIGLSAFYKCSSLQKISFPKTLTKIEEFAFAYCSKIQEIDLTQTDIQSIESQSFASTNFDINNFKLDYTSGAEFAVDVFDNNPYISNERLAKRYPFCYFISEEDLKKA